MTAEVRCERLQYCPALMEGQAAQMRAADAPGIGDGAGHVDAGR
jgi:hypothetical protein